jgi:hypothetical protein
MARAEAQRTQRTLFRQDEQDEQDEEWIENRESLLFILSILIILSKFLSCSALSAPLREKIFAKCSIRRNCNAKVQRQRRQDLKAEVLCSEIPENCSFLAKFSEPSFRMANEKFSMTNFQFRLSALVAASAALRLCVFSLDSSCQTPIVPNRA